MLTDSSSPDMSHKRTIPLEVQPMPLRATNSGSTSSTTDSIPLASLWEQQKESKRPRTGEYRERDVETTDDENESSAEDEKAYSSAQTDDSDTAHDERRRIPQRTSSGKLKWILRQESKSPSFSSVITEVSELEIASAMGADLNIRNRHRRHHASVSSQPPIDTLVRNMETWSLTHIRALRRNNLFERPENATGERSNYRQTVKAAQRDVMRALRRGSSSISSEISVGSNNNSNVSSSAVQSADSLSVRASSSASLNSLQTI